MLDNDEIDFDHDPNPAPDDRATLRAALAPFARLAVGVRPDWPDDRHLWIWFADNGRQLGLIKVGDVRRAAAVYAATAGPDAPD